MIIIIGAGITGLVTAYRLKKAGKSVCVLEASSRPGGNINSQQHGPYLLECGPNTLLLNDRLYALLDELGLAPGVKKASPRARYRYVLREGKYEKLPAGPLGFLLGGFFNMKEKARIWKERRVAPGNQEAESVDTFFRRRFGDAVADYVVAPFVSGVYAGDPAQLQAELAFPKLVAHEKEKGSVIKGMLASAKNRDEHRGIFSLPGGLQAFTDRLAEELGDRIILNSPAQAIEPTDDGHWRVLVGNDQAYEAEKVVASVPSFVLADLIEAWDPDEAAVLRGVHYPPAAGVYTAYRKSDVSHPLDGFGALHNHVEPSETLGTIFNSTVFDDRCPEDQVLLTSFIGGSRHPEKARLPEEEIGELACLDHARLLGVKGEPLFQHVVVWPRGIPQYDETLPPALAAADRLESRGIIAAANWRGGISVPNCVENGLALGERLAT